VFLELSLQRNIGGTDDDEIDSVGIGLIGMNSFERCLIHGTVSALADCKKGSEFGISHPIPDRKL
jgi:hypothetical protein